MVAFRRLQWSHLADLDELLHALDVTIIPFDEAQALFAPEAYRRFGKGWHPAALNLSECFSYALAGHLDEPLLFKGDDFRQTDVLVA